MGFKYDINRYLAGHGDKIPMKSLAEIVKSRPLPSDRARSGSSRRRPAPSNGPETDACKAEMTYREQVRAAVNKAMDAQKIDAWVYPTWSNPPRLIGDLNTPGGDNSQFFSPTTGLPVDPGADGLHARRTAAGGHHVLRPRVVGAGADQVRVRLRAGDASSASAREHAAAALELQLDLRTLRPKTSEERSHGDQRHAHAVLHVGSRNKLRAMLRDVFGFKHVDAGGGWLIFALPPSEIGVHPDEGPTYESGMRHQITFMCDDINKTIAELRAKGVMIDGEPKDEGYGITTMLHLPGGCDVMLVRAAPRDRGGRSNEGSSSALR